MKKVICFLFCAVSIIQLAYSLTIVPGGNVSGVWTAAGSPYLIQGEITIPADSYLNIEPGVEVNFQGYYKFIINGLLYAVGTVQDSILFTATNIEIGWHSLRFINASDGCQLSYCIIEHGKASGQPWDNWGGGIYCYYSNPTISCNSIRENTADDAGGGIACHYSSPTITDNLISQNSVIVWHGGGIFCVESNPIISGNTISENYSHGRGGGICCTDHSSPAIIGNFIKDNYSNIWGGGIYTENYSNPTIVSNIIIGNYANFGGGIYCYHLSNTICNNLISENMSGNDGGGIYLRSSSPILINNTIVFNSLDIESNSSGGGITTWDGSNPQLINCILWGNFREQIRELAGVTVNYSNVQNSWPGIGNIDSDPLFVSGPEGYYYLSQLDAGQSFQSPCVDAGDPNTPIYAGWTRSNEIQDTGIWDMGYHYGYQYPPIPPPLSSVDGTLTPAMEGVTIDLLDISNMLLATDLTSLSGEYLFDSLYAGDYIVEIVIPLGFTANPTADTVSLDGSNTATVNFTLTPIVTANNARGKGYWKHQVNANISGKGNTDFDTEELLEFAQINLDHFAGNSGSPVMVENVTYVDNLSTPLGMSDLQYMLNLNQGGSTMYDRACQQLLTLLLNVVSNKLAQYADASEDGAAVCQAIVYIDSILVSQSELAKDIAEILNEGQLVGAGVIPLTTPYVIFGDGLEGILQPLTFEFKNPSPNPFNPDTKLRFTLPEAGDVSLIVYDIRGREVANLMEGFKPAGIYNLTFDGSNLASGIYFAKLKTGKFCKVQKLLLIK